jgi:hypothetical protein
MQGLFVIQSGINWNRGKKQEAGSPKQENQEEGGVYFCFLLHASRKKKDLGRW